MHNKQYQLFQTNWILPTGKSSTDQISSLCVGSILNLCCGISKLGYCVDIDRTLSPSMLADIFHLPFRRQSFDTIIIDPPYRYFVTGSNRFRWIFAASDIARKRLILSSGQIFIRIPNFKLVDIIAVIPRTFFVRLWYVYDRINEVL